MQPDMTPAPHSALLTHLLRPLRGAAAALVIVFAVLFLIALKAGFAGIPLALVLFSWFFKYCYILFDHTVRGVPEAPALDIHWLNPANEQRPLVQLALGFLGFMLVRFLDTHLGSGAATAVAAALLLMLPASIAILGLEGNPLKAVNPVAWVKLVAGLGPWYLVVIALVGAVAAAVTALWIWVPIFVVQVAVLMFGLLAIFSVLGGALYERRDHLGIEVWHSPERTAERREAETHRQDLKVLDTAHDQVRIGSHQKAWKILSDWLAARGGEPEDYRWLCERLAPWPDPRYANRIMQEYVARLLVLRRHGEAIDLVTRRLREDPQFRPGNAATTLAFAQLAARGGARATARKLLADFPERFPGDVAVAAARTLTAELNV
jgi:hypothetical protein